jgi:hypothetical protein
MGWGKPRPRGAKGATGPRDDLACLRRHRATGGYSPAPRGCDDRGRGSPTAEARRGIGIGDYLVEDATGRLSLVRLGEIITPWPARTLEVAEAEQHQRSAGSRILSPSESAEPRSRIEIKPKPSGIWSPRLNTDEALGSAIELGEDIEPRPSAPSA